MRLLWRKYGSTPGLSASKSSMTARSMPYRNGVTRGMKTRVTPVGGDIAEGTTGSAAGSANTWVFTIFDIQLQTIGSLKSIPAALANSYPCVVVDWTL